MRALSLCSGIGGIDLAAQWAGFEIAGQIEINPFCQMILQQQFSGVPLFSDLKVVSTYEKEELEEVFGTIDVIVGGIPCQPFSSAGKRRGTKDDRHLWPYAFALIKKLQPTWILIENVRNFVPLALDLVLSDLEAMCYEAQAFVFPSCATGSPHIRERCFVLAHSTSGRCSRQSDTGRLHTKLNTSSSGMANASSHRQWFRTNQQEFGGTCTTTAIIANDGPETIVSNSDLQSLEVGPCLTGNAQSQCQATQRIYNFRAGGDLAAQSRMGGSTYGISARLDTAKWPAGPGEKQHDWEPSRTIKGKTKWRRQRLEALGNAVNPYQVYPFFGLMKQSMVITNPECEGIA